MFDNISKLRFVQGPAGEPIANAMISSEGEIMEYRQGVLAEGKVCLHTHKQHHTSIYHMYMHSKTVDRTHNMFQLNIVFIYVHVCTGGGLDDRCTE